MTRDPNLDLGAAPTSSPPADLPIPAGEPPGRIGPPSPISDMQRIGDHMDTQASTHRPGSTGGHRSLRRTGPGAMAVEPAQMIGQRLRRIRRQQGLSLADVEERSGGTWKAVVVGAYERGDRTVSISRLAGLADFYRVPLADLLPRKLGPEEAPEHPEVVLDLTKLDEPGDEATQAVARFANRIRSLRGDHNGRVLSLRGQDLASVAFAIGREPTELQEQLDQQGVLIHA